MALFNISQFIKFLNQAKALNTPKILEYNSSSPSLSYFKQVQEIQN